jgi:hypothetical protein
VISEGIKGEDFDFVNPVKDGDKCDIMDQFDRNGNVLITTFDQPLLGISLFSREAKRQRRSRKPRFVRNGR